MTKALSTLLSTDSEYSTVVPGVQCRKEIIDSRPNFAGDFSSAKFVQGTGRKKPRGLDLCPIVTLPFHLVGQGGGDIFSEPWVVKLSTRAVLVFLSQDSRASGR